eukprot:7525892-Pyramimonas_sp.AAC.1
MASLQAALRILKICLKNGFVANGALLLLGLGGRGELLKLAIGPRQLREEGPCRMHRSPRGPWLATLKATPPLTVRGCTLAVV